MRISELLKQKGSIVVTVGPDEPVSAIVQVLRVRNIGAVVVSSDGARIEGIASERDVVRALDERGAAVLGQPVREIMSSDVLTCSPDDAVDSLVATMTNFRIRHVPVAEAGALCGIVSIGDVVKTRLVELESDRDALVDYIGAR